MTTTESTTRSNGQTLKDLLERARPAIVQVLPKHLSVDRMLKVALSATARSSALQRCTSQSILRAVMQAAELGLEPGGLLGDAYLVPFRNKIRRGDGQTVLVEEAQLIVGYRGYIRLARQSGEVSTIAAHVVRERDSFEVEYGLTPRLVHRPNFREARGEPICAYACLNLKDGGYQIDVMSREEIEAIRARSRARDSGPWVTDTAEMWRKTVVRRLLKYAPLSSEQFRRMQEHDEHTDAATIDVGLIDEPAPQLEEAPKRARAKALATKIAATARAADDGPAPSGEADEPPPTADEAPYPEELT